MVRNEGTAATTRRRTSSEVWEIFTKNRHAAGEALTATCGECGKTLRAASSIGTSHLLRHIRSKGCHKLAAKRRRRQQQQLMATAPSFTAEASPPPSGDHSTSPAALVCVEEEEFFVVDGIDVPELLDYLVDEDLANIDEEEPSRVDEHLFSGNCYVPAVPQAARSSTMWFRQKKKERKWAESNKGKDESAMDLMLSAQAEFRSREKRMLLPNSAATTATVEDHSHQASNESRAAALYKLG